MFCHDAVSYSNEMCVMIYSSENHWSQCPSLRDRRIFETAGLESTFDKNS